MQKNIIEDEKYLIEEMIKYYCKKKHSSINLCSECNSLNNYAKARLDNCPHGPNKPSCRKCTIHCYNDENRGKIKEVMKFSGPRMILYHPILTIKHIIK